MIFLGIGYQIAGIGITITGLTNRINTNPADLFIFLVDHGGVATQRKDSNP